MTLHPDWKRILRRAWSIRLMLIAGLLSGVEAALPLLSVVLPLPPGLLALLSCAVVGGAFIARLVAQKDL